MGAVDTRERLLAAQALFLGSPFSLGHIARIRTLVQGINPRVDTALEKCSQAASGIEHVLDGDVITLGAEHLPETTDEEKKRKKKVLFFIGTWNSLKGEVARVQAEFASGKNVENQAGVWTRIFKMGKGPLGIVTITAVGIVLLTQAVQVQIAIHNDGCDPLIPEVKLPFSLPGLSLPSEPIVDGSVATATVPGLTFSIDGTKAGVLSAKILNYSMNFVLAQSLDDVRLDGASLIGVSRNINLGAQKEHALVFVCR